MKFLSNICALIIASVALIASNVQAQPIVLPILNSTAPPVPPSFFTNSGWLLVDKNGSDSFARRGVATMPFLTITAAKLAAKAGDTIYVNPGIYKEKDLLKVGVNYYFMPGAIVYVMDKWPSPDARGVGVFDDRFIGATTNIIGGYGQFVWNSGTNWALDYNAAQSFVGDTNDLAVVYITNANTSISMDAVSIAVSGFYRAQAALYVVNCTNSTFHINYIFDPYINNPTTTNDLNPDTGFGLLTGSPSSQAIYWEVGEMHVSGDTIGRMATYGIQAYGGYSNQVASLWVDYHNMDGRAYIVGHGSSEYRTYLRFMEVTNTSGAPFIYYGSGRHYLVINGKAQDSTGQALISTTQTNGLFELWITAQTLKSTGSWLDIANGKVTTTGPIDFKELAGGNGIPGIIVRTNGTLILQGGQATKTNGPIVFHEGGTAKIQDLYASVSGTGTNAPVFTKSVGLTLQNMVIVAPAGTNSISATNAQTVALYGTSMANLIKNANVTTNSGGILIIDSNVK